MSTEQTLTPAQELRAAASKIRTSGGAVVDGNDISEAVANWLDAWADFIARDMALPRRSEAYVDLDDITELAAPAFAITAAILAGAR